MIKPGENKCEHRMAGTLDPNVRICLNGCGRKERKRYQKPDNYIDLRFFIWEEEKN